MANTPTKFRANNLSDVNVALNTIARALFDRGRVHDGSGGSVSVDLSFAFHRIDSPATSLTITTTGSPPTPEGVQIAVNGESAVTIDGVSLVDADADQIIRVVVIDGSKRYEQLRADGAKLGGSDLGNQGVTALTPGASVSVPSDVVQASLTPDQATELDLETTDVTDGTTKWVRIEQPGGGGYAITFAGTITPLFGVDSTQISTTAGAVSYVYFVYNESASRWEVLSVGSED